MVCGGVESALPRLAGLLREGDGKGMLLGCWVGFRCGVSGKLHCFYEREVGGIEFMETVMCKFEQEFFGACLEIGSCDWSGASKARIRIGIGRQIKSKSAISSRTLVSWIHHQTQQSNRHMASNPLQTLKKQQVGIKISNRSFGWNKEHFKIPSRSLFSRTSSERHSLLVADPKYLILSSSAVDAPMLVDHRPW